MALEHIIATWLVTTLPTPSHLHLEIKMIDNKAPSADPIEKLTTNISRYKTIWLSFYAQSLSLDWNTWLIYNPWAIFNLLVEPSRKICDAIVNISHAVLL